MIHLENLEHLEERRIAVEEELHTVVEGSHKGVEKALHTVFDGMEHRFVLLEDLEALHNVVEEHCIVQEAHHMDEAVGQARHIGVRHSQVLHSQVLQGVHRIGLEVLLVVHRSSVDRTLWIFDYRCDTQYDGIGWSLEYYCCIIYSEVSEGFAISCAGGNQ